MRLMAVTGIVLAMCFSSHLKAQDRAAEAAARAERLASEESYRILNGKLETMAETQEMLLRNQESLRQRLNALTTEIENMKRSQALSGANSVSRDQLKELVDKMQEVDRKRADDKELILKTLRDLQKMPVVAAPPPAETRRTPPPAAEPSIPAWEYQVKRGDTLTEIIAAYNAKLKEEGLGSITLSQVIAANPGLNPDLLHEGRKILIPKPAR